MAQPTTRAVDQHDDYFGTDVADPYRWLENTDDPEVSKWLAEQGDRTRGYLDELPGRDAIVATLRRAVGLPRRGVPVRRGPWWFRTENDGAQQQDVLVVSDSPDGPSRVLIDPNPLTPDSSTGLAAFVPSPDGALVAYAYIEAGSDWRTWRVRETATGADRADEVRWSKFTHPAWLPDGSGFVHGRFAAPVDDEFVAANAGQWLDLHRIGTDQSEDEQVFALPDEPDVTFWPEITADGRWLVVLGTRGTEHAARLWVRDLTDENAQLRLVIPEATASWHPLGTVADELVLLTDLDAPLSRVVALDPRTGEVRELVSEQADALESAVVAARCLVLHYLHDATSRLETRTLDGVPLGLLALPGVGSVTALEAQPDDAAVRVAWTSFTEPPGVLAFDIHSGAMTREFSAGLATDVVTEQIFVTSPDGTQVPVFLLRRPDVTPESGPHPAWLYGYGGFRLAITPEFEPTRWAFAAAGGVAAVACLRGGAEYGAAWHDAGRRANKQNVFDDAIAVAEQLVAAGWTTRAQLAASGRSNGGLLAGALLTQRPELFAAVVPEVGVLDLLRFPLWTIGWAWISDYGDPRASEEEFRVLHGYSPLHNLREGAGYPPVLVLTSDHDDRVVPAHSLKFTARLQAVSPPDAIALLRVEAAGGHKEGRSRAALIAERADVLAFVSRHVGLDWG